MSRHLGFKGRMVMNCKQDINRKSEIFSVTKGIKNSHVLFLL